MNYIIATHTVYNKKSEETFGPANSIAEFLIAKNKNIYFIKHPLERSNTSIVIFPDQHSAQFDHKSKNVLFNAVSEIAINLKFSKKFGKDSTYIGIDPINGIAGITLKLLRRTGKYIYLTADYTEKRFGNQILNLCYHLADRICLKFCDESWSVSSRITQKRSEQGVPPEKNKLLVNSPDFDSIDRKDYDGNQDLIIISPLSLALNLSPIIKSLKPLFHDYPKLRLQIVGTGDEEQNFKKMVRSHKLDGKINFLGWKQHDEIFDLMCSSFLGFALYSGAASWNIYGDSMKTREYVACGLPVIINTIPSTADDVKKYNAGLVLSTVDEDEITAFIKKCLDDKEFYLTLRENAQKMGKDFDKSVILSKLLHL